MRRVVGLVLTGLGAFLIVIAIVLPTWITGQVIKFPLNEYETATLTATNASYFSATKLTEITGANIRATYTIKGNAAAGNSSTAVWNEFSYVYDTTNSLEVNAMTRTFAFDRKTAQLVNCCGESINGDSSIQQSGVVGYVFPINTQKQTYMIFDTTLDKQVPFVYSGTDNVSGIQAYKFVNTIAPVKIGFSQLSASEPEYYSMNLTYWVDPETGALVKVNEHENEYLINAITGATAATLFNADLTTTPATVASVMALDNSGRNKLVLLQTILPLVFGIVGALAIVVGFLLTRRPREDVESGLAPAVAASPRHAAGGAERVVADREVTKPNGTLVPGMDGEREPADAAERDGKETS
jgi:hypothetical protein